MRLTQLTTIKKACEAVASAETCCYPEAYDREKSPLDGHCAAVATMLQGIFGGDIVTGKVKGIRHYWNRIEGKEYDLTSCQFGGDGYFPLEKGRKASRPELLDPRFLLFAQRVYQKLREPLVGIEYIMEEVTSAWAKLNCCHGVLHTLIEKGWLSEDKEAKSHFPKGGVWLVESTMIEVYRHLTNCLQEQDRMKDQQHEQAEKEKKRP